MSKNFNNNSLIDSSLNLNVQNLTNNVALLPTQTSLNTSITNAINTNNLLYTLKTDLTTALIPYSNSTITNNLINQLISTNNTVYIANLLLSTVNSQITDRNNAITTALLAYTTSILTTNLINQLISSNNNLYITNTNLQLLYPLRSDLTAALIPYSTTVTSTNLVNQLISTNNTVYIANLLLSTVSGQISDRNNAIASALLAYPLKTDIITSLANYATTSYVTSAITINNNTINNNIINNTNSNNTANLALSKTYTAKQIFSDLDCNGTLTMANNHVLSYNVLPPFSAKQVGSQINMTAIRSFTTFDVIANILSVTISAGIYLINYTITLNTSLTSANTIWIAWGLGGIGDLNIQPNKSYCSPRFGSTTFHGLSNSFLLTVQTNTTLYLNTIINTFDNPSIVITNYSCIATLSYTRIA